MAMGKYVTCATRIITCQDGTVSRKNSLTSKSIKDLMPNLVKKSHLEKSFGVIKFSTEKSNGFKHARDSSMVFHQSLRSVFMRRPLELGQRNHISLVKTELCSKFFDISVISTKKLKLRKN